MPEHLVVYRAPCPLLMSKRGGFQFDDVLVHVVDHFETSEWSQRRVHRGLEFRAFLEADDPRLAIKRGRETVEIVCNMLSASHGVAVDSPAAVVSINVDPAGSDRPFAQPFRDLPAELLPRRPFVFDAVGLFSEGRNQLPANVRPAVDRALSHLRKSAGLEDLVEQLVELWVGFEAVNSAIKRRHGLPLERPIRRCPACGEAVVLSPTSAGIKHAIVDLAGYRNSDWRAARKLRQLILHGQPDFIADHHDFPRITDILRHALVAAISDLLGVSSEEQEQLLRPALRVADLPNMLIYGRYQELSRAAILKRSEVPMLRLVGVLPPGQRGEFLGIRTEQGQVLEIAPPDEDFVCKLEGVEFKRYEDPEKMGVGS